MEVRASSPPVNIERQSELYIFCLLENQTPSPEDPLDLNRWSFYLFPTAKLNKHVPEQRSISLAKLIKLGAEKLKFSELKEAVRLLEKQLGTPQSNDHRD